MSKIQQLFFVSKKVTQKGKGITEKPEGLGTDTSHTFLTERHETHILQKGKGFWNFPLERLANVMDNYLEGRL